MGNFKLFPYLTVIFGLAIAIAIDLPISDNFLLLLLAFFSIFLGLAQIGDHIRNKKEEQFRNEWKFDYILNRRKEVEYYLKEAKNLFHRNPEHPLQWELELTIDELNLLHQAFSELFNQVDIIDAPGRETYLKREYESLLMRKARATNRLTQLQMEIAGTRLQIIQEKPKNESGGEKQASKTDHNSP